MLRVHQPDLARRHTEKLRVKPRYVIDETCPTGYNLPGRIGIWVEEFVGIPAVLGHLRYRIPAFGQHLPEFVRVRGTRKTGRVADDRKTRCPRHRIFDGRLGCGENDPFPFVLAPGVMAEVDYLSRINGKSPIESFAGQAPARPRAPLSIRG
jgi:hypothetical protein